MPNPVDPWREIAALIAREKEGAIREFPATPLPKPEPGPGRLHRLPAFALLAAAAVLLVVGAGLVLHLRSRTTGAPHTGTGSPPSLASALARAPLFQPRVEYPLRIGGDGAPSTSFSRQLAATGFMATAAHPAAAAPAAVPGATAATAEESRREIGAVIRKKVLLQFVTRFYHPSEEV